MFSSSELFEEYYCPSIFFEENKFLEDLIVDCPVSEGKKDFSFSGDQHDESSSKEKKTAHKFSERQRRQEMASLYASLRSLLPLEYIKGKRAVSDHMEQAVNYINDMKKRIEEMQVRREKLRRKRRSNICISDDRRRSTMSAAATTGAADSLECVKISISRDGKDIEILINEENSSSFHVSRVLADLLSRQLYVVDYVSIRGQRRRCLHKIHIQLNDSTSMDLCELLEGLEKLIKFA